MHELNRHSKDRRGSSPPFQEIEKWADDGANGAHWIKMVAAAFQREEAGLMVCPAPEKIFVAEPDDEARWEDDGGRNMSAHSDGARVILEQ